MSVERHSVRQLGTAFFVALLASASALPTVLAQGDVMGWTGPLLVLPVGLLALWAFRRLGPAGLAGALRGKWPLLTLYYLWAAALAALTAGSCADRLSRTDYAEAPSWLLSLAIGGVAAYLTAKGPAPFFRAVRIFFLALLVVLALLLVLGATTLEPGNVAVSRADQIPGALRSVFPAAGSLAVGALAAIFPRQEGPGLGKGWRWLLLWCAVAAGLCLLVLGALGPKLTARAPLPFFLALQGLGFPGGFQRLEALVTAAWVLSDVTMLGLSALAGRELTGKSWAIWPILLAGFAGGCLLPNAAVAAAGGWLWGANLALGVGGPILLALCRSRGGGTSCG